MRIHCLGLNHHTAEVGLREQLAFTDESLKAALARIGCGEGTRPDSVSEMVILSTCNRVEIYAIAPDLAFDALRQFMAEVQGVERDAFAGCLYEYEDSNAVEHLFRVSAGLDSLVLGEPQILGQVMHAFELARGQNTVGPFLSRLFQMALRAGKRARTETCISHNPASISSVAIRLAEQSVEAIADAQIVVVGAGEMAELAVEALRKRGSHKILVVNRTMDRANQLASRWNARAATLEHLADAILQADLLITSTGAPHTILFPDFVRPVIAARNGRPLIIIDIAVPRDVDPEVGEFPGVKLYDIDSLQSNLEDSLARRAQEVPHVKAILAQVKAEFDEYLTLLDVFPLIAEMHQRGEQIRQTELEKTLRRLPDLTPAERAHVTALTEALVKKILHAPITCLKSAAGGPDAAEFAATTRILFDLEAAQSVQSFHYAGQGD